MDYLKERQLRKLKILLHRLYKVGIAQTGGVVPLNQYRGTIVNPGTDPSLSNRHKSPVFLPL